MFETSVPLVSLHNPSFHVIYHFLVHVIWRTTPVITDRMGSVWGFVGSVGLVALTQGYVPARSKAKTLNPKP